MEIVAYKGRPFSGFVDDFFLSHFALLYCHVVDIYIYQNSQKYNRQDLCRLSLLFFFAEIRRCLFGAPCSRRVEGFVLFLWKTQDTGYRFSDAKV